MPFCACTCETSSKLKLTELLFSKRSRAPKEFEGNAEGAISPNFDRPRRKAPKGRRLVAGGVSLRTTVQAGLQAPTGRKSCQHVPVSALILATALSFLQGCQTSPTHAEAKVQAEQRWTKVRGQVKFQLARQQFDRGLFDDAIKTLQESNALDPTNADAFALLAKANLELGKPTTAEQAIQAAAKSGLNNAELEYLKGLIHEQRNELPPALSQYEKACALDSTRVDYLLARIETLVALDRFSEALALADANAGQFDDDVSVALLAARIAVLMGDSKGALERFQNPAIQNAGSTTAIEDFGSLLASQGHCHEAIRVLQPLCDASESASEAGPLSAGAYRSLADCYMKGNEPKRAMEVLGKHLARNPNDAASQLLLARAALAAGEYMTALQAIEAARRGHSDDSDFNLLLATTHWKRGDMQGALRVLDGILSSNPTDVDAWCLKGEALLGQHRADEARDAFERALDLDPDCRWASDQLGDSEGRLNHLKPSEKKITKKS